MLVTNDSNFRNNMKKYFDEVTNHFTPVMITRKNNENIVILSAKEYQNIIENQYVLGNAKNKAWLDASKQQLEMKKA